MGSLRARPRNGLWTTLRFALAALLCVYAGSTFAKYPLQLDVVARGQAKDIFLENLGPAPVNVVLELTLAQNIGFNPVLVGRQFAHFLAPGQRKYITTAVPLKKNLPGLFNFRPLMAFGDSKAEPDDGFTYRLPIGDGQRAVIRQYSGLAADSMVAETNNAAEFLMPEDSSIVAARDGMVIDVVDTKDEQDAGVPNPYGTHLSILHADGTWAVYAWVKPGSVKVALGDKVKEGDALAISGKNPASLEPYLHFAVMRNMLALDVRSIIVQFKEAGHTSPITLTNYRGPVSPNLSPRYPIDDPAGMTYTPPTEGKEVSKKLVDRDMDDPKLTPTERQRRHRERVLESLALSDTGWFSKEQMLGMTKLALVIALLGIFAGASMGKVASVLFKPIWNIAAKFGIRLPTSGSIGTIDVEAVERAHQERVSEARESTQLKPVSGLTVAIGDSSLDKAIGETDAKRQQRAAESGPQGAPGLPIKRERPVRVYASIEALLLAACGTTFRIERKVQIPNVVVLGQGTETGEQPLTLEYLVSSRSKTQTSRCVVEDLTCPNDWPTSIRERLHEAGIKIVGATLGTTPDELRQQIEQELA